MRFWADVVWAPALDTQRMRRRSSRVGSHSPSAMIYLTFRLPMRVINPPSFFLDEERKGVGYGLARRGEAFALQAKEGQVPCVSSRTGGTGGVGSILR